MMFLYKLLCEKIKIIFITAFGFFGSIFLMILLSPTLFIFWIISKFVYSLIKLKLGDKFLRPGGLDIIQGMESEKSRPYISAIGRFKGNVDIEGFRNKFQSEILNIATKRGTARYKKFTQVFEEKYGYHIFKDAENFDIKRHIRKIELKELFPEKFENCAEIQKSTKVFNNIITNEIKTTDTQTNIHSYSANTLNFNNEPNSYRNEEERTQSNLLPFIEWEILINRLMEKYGMEPLPPGHPQWEVLFVEENG